MDFLIGAFAAVAYSAVQSSSTTQNANKKSSKSQCGGSDVVNASEGFYEINAIEYMALSAVENMHTIIASVKENKRMSIELEQEVERHKQKNKRKLKMDARMVGKISQGLQSVQQRQRIKEYARRMKERESFIREQKRKRNQNQKGPLIQQAGGGFDWLNILGKTRKEFEKKSNIQTKENEEFTFVKHFLAYADSIHDFNDKRSLLKYKFKRELTPEMKKGFEIIKSNALIKKPTALLFSSDMETKMFNYIHNVTALTYDKSPQHLDDFKYYIGSSTKTKRHRVFRYSEAFVNSKEKRKITSGEIELMFRSHGLSHYNVDISISRGTVVDHKSFGLNQIISIMNIWDPAKSAPKTDQPYTDVTYISTDSEKSDSFRDPRLFDFFCIQDNRDDGIRLDLYCDNEREVNLQHQRTDPINKVILISVIIVLIENLDDNAFVNLELEESVLNKTLKKIQEQGLRIRRKITAKLLKSFTNLWKKNKTDIINSVEVICDRNSTVHSFFQQLQDEVANGKKKEILTVLYEMKKTGDWGQASWVYETNKQRKKNKQIIFISGDRLAALYSILIGNNTLFGAQNLAGIRGKVWGTYLPSTSSMKGKGKPEADETKENSPDYDKDIMSLIGTDRSLYQGKHFCKNETYKELLTSLFSIDYSAIYNELSGQDISLSNKDWYTALNKLTIESNITIEEFLVYDFMMFTVPTLYSYIVEFEEHHKCVSFTPEGWIGIMQAKLNVPNRQQFSINEDKLLQIGILNDWIFTHEEETL